MAVRVLATRVAHMFSCVFMVLLFAHRFIAVGVVPDVIGNVFRVIAICSELCCFSNLNSRRLSKSSVRVYIVCTQPEHVILISQMAFVLLSLQQSRAD